MVYLHQLWKFFILRENTNVRNFQEISKESRKTVNHGIETILDRTPFLWVNLPKESKMATFLHDFKLKIKNWHCNKCACRLFQNFQQNLGFL